MSYRNRVIIAAVGCALSMFATGCLNLGGRTTYTSESPETTARVSSLENRVGVLEQAVLGRPSTAVDPTTASPAAGTIEFSSETAWPGGPPIVVRQ
jgi:hypothetical protein